MRLQLQQAWIDDLKVHDVADATMVYALRSAKRTITPRRVEQPRTNRHGIVDFTRPLFGAQVIDLAGYVNAGTDAATELAYDALTQRLVAEGGHVFRFRRLGRTEDEQVAFTLGGGPDDDQPGGYARTIRWAASLVGADPRVYSATLKGSSYDPTANLSGGGMPMPLVFPLVFSSTTADELIVQNQGTTKTPPLLTIRGPVSYPIVDNDTTGESILINAILGAADTIVVDVAGRSLTLNGAIRRDLIIVAGTSWFGLPPGEVRLRLRGTNMVTGQTLLTVAYRDARN